MKLKSIILTICITFILTILLVFTVEYFIFGMNKKPHIVFSADSPDGVYKAYAEESPSIDPPNQSLFISKNGTKEFRLVCDLPEDIDMIKQIDWSVDSKTVVFTTGWYLIITNVERFNIRKISLNTDWWKWHKEYNGTFSSSNKIIDIEKIKFINTDTLEFKTKVMPYSEKICLTDINYYAQQR